THDGAEEGLAHLRVGFDREHVLAERPLGVAAAEDLAAAGPGALALGALAARDAGVLGQLVGAVERWGVGGRVEARADAEAVDRRAGGEQGVDDALVQAAA